MTLFFFIIIQNLFYLDDILPAMKLTKYIIEYYYYCLN